MTFSSDFTSQEIDCRTLAYKLEAEADVQLIDVREPWELQRAAIAGFINLPMSEFQAWETHILQQFDPEMETIVMCHHGIRSAHMCQWLKAQGFTQVKNLSGGIDAYSIAIDRSIPRY